MKLPSGKRFGQSDYDLAFAVFYSFFLHAAILFVMLFAHFSMFTKTVLPPVYQVKLVGGVQKELESKPAPAPPKKEAMPVEKPSPMPKKREAEPKKAVPKKNAMPELGQVKQKPAPPAQTKETEVMPEQAPAVPSAPAEVSPGAGEQSEGVAVTPQQDFKYSWYLANVSAKIKQNWNPPPDTKDAKARVNFIVNRSGWVVLVQLDEEQSNGSFPFKQAAVRAIRASNPFPRLPDEFFKQSLELTVDLIPEQ
jgi:outer membrane biosynthesis protein TonB